MLFQIFKYDTFVGKRLCTFEHGNILDGSKEPCNYKYEILLYYYYYLSLYYTFKNKNNNNVK